MRKTLLLLAVVLAGCAAQARAGASAHVGGYGCHGPSCGRGYSYGHAFRSCGPIFYSAGYYADPDDYYDSSSYLLYSPDTDGAGVPPAAPAPAHPPAPAPHAAQQKAPNPIPYGFNIGTKLVQSPWSGFVINGANKAPEQVVYDANTGQAFRIPPL